MARHNLLMISTKMDNRADKDKDRITADADSPSLEEISRVEEWITICLAVEKKDSLWETQMSIVLGDSSHNLEAEQRCHTALELDPSNWRASHSLAKLATTLDDGINILNDLTARLCDDTEWMENLENKKALATMFYDQAEKYWENEQFDEAVQIYARSVDSDPTNHLQDLKILQKYQATERWADVIELLETKMASANEIAQQGTPMAIKLSDDEDFNEILLDAALLTKKFDPLEKIYRDAIKYATDHELHREIYFNHYYYGVALSHRAEREKEAMMTLEIALREDLPRSYLHRNYYLPKLVQVLAPLYLRKALSANLNSETDDYLTRISTWLHDETIERSMNVPAKVYLARYYHLAKDFVKSKELIKSTMKVAVEMLSDDDPDNDVTAFKKLLAVFLPLDDDENACAALAMLTFACQAEKAKRSTKSEEKEVEEVAGLVDLSVPADEKAGGTDGGDVDDGQVPLSETNEVKLQQIEDSSEKLANTTALHEETGDEKRTSIVSATVDVQDHAEGDEDDESDWEDEDEDEDDGEVDDEDEDEGEGESEDDGYAGGFLSMFIHAIQDAIVYDRNRIIAQCGGRCGREWDMASELWCCKDCIEITFCSDCYIRLLDGTLPRRVCDKDHKFLVLGEWDKEKMDQIPNGSVPVGEEVLSLAEWRDRVKMKYLDFKAVIHA
jgi:tetratricopeptide (TPR) repeat protein